MANIPHDLDNTPAAAVPGEVTRLLRAWQAGDREAGERLMPIVFGELHHIAAAYLASERGGHTLQATALVNEAFLRLVEQRAPWQTRTHFYGIAAQAIRRILTDHARRAVSARRGGGRQHAQVPIEEAATLVLDRPEDFLELDMALDALAKVDPLKARIVEYRYFGGLTGEEIATLTGQSAATVQRNWQLARAWLLRELSGDPR